MNTSGFGGHGKIYADLLKRLASADITRLAEHLNLPINSTGEAEIPFLDQIYLISNKGVRRSDQRTFPETTGSVLIHYLLAGSSSRPAGKFVPLAELAGPLFKQSSYSQSALEGPLVKRFQEAFQNFYRLRNPSVVGREAFPD